MRGIVGRTTGGIPMRPGARPKTGVYAGRAAASPREGPHIPRPVGPRRAFLRKLLPASAEFRLDSGNETLTLHSVPLRVTYGRMEGRTAGGIPMRPGARPKTGVYAYVLKPVF